MVKLVCKCCDLFLFFFLKIRHEKNKYEKQKNADLASATVTNTQMLHIEIGQQWEMACKRAN